MYFKKFFLFFFLHKLRVICYLIRWVCPVCHLGLFWALSLVRYGCSRSWNRTFCSMTFARLEFAGMLWTSQSVVSLQRAVTFDLSSLFHLPFILSPSVMIVRTSRTCSCSCSHASAAFQHMHMYMVIRTVSDMPPMTFCPLGPTPVFNSPRSTWYHSELRI